MSKWVELTTGDNNWTYDLEPRDGERRWLHVYRKDDKIIAKIRYRFLTFTYIELPDHITDLEEAKAVALMIAKMS